MKRRGVRLWASTRVAVWDLARRHDALVDQMLAADVPIAIRREQSTGDLPPRGWFLAAAGRALLADPEVSIEWV